MFDRVQKTPLSNLTPLPVKKVSSNGQLDQLQNITKKQSDANIL